MAFDSEQEFNEWCMAYYRAPEPSLVPKAIGYAGSSGLIQDPAFREPLVAFFSTVIQREPQYVEDWIRNLGAGETDLREFLMECLWRAEEEAMLNDMEMDASGEELRFVQRLYDQRRPEILADPLSTAGHLDALWAVFFATGDPEPVSKIIDALSWTDEVEDLDRLLLGTVAQWSLTANAKEHPRVADICRKELPNRNGVIREKLEQVLDEAQ